MVDMVYSSSFGGEVGRCWESFMRCDETSKSERRKKLTTDDRQRKCVVWFVGLCFGDVRVVVVPLQQQNTIQYDINKYNHRISRQYN